MWVFYHQNQGHTIWYFISVIFKAIFGDLQGFFTSLIYFYFNTEIRYEVLRQVQRTLSANERVGRSSVTETLSTRFSTFRRSISRYRQASIPNRFDRRRHSPTNKKSQRTNWCKKSLLFLCPCFIQNLFLDKQRTTTEFVRQEQSPPQQPLNDTPVAIVPEIHIIENDLANISPPRDVIDLDDLTCDTDVVRNEHIIEDELLTDENDVTYQHSSTMHDDLHMNRMPTVTINPFHQRNRSNSDGFVLKKASFDPFSDSISLK